MCQSTTTNCCVTCCVPTKGKAAWLTLAAVLAAAFALVCVWAWVAVQVDALVLFRTARLSLTDMPTVVTSWWSPTARHQLAHQVARSAVVLPAGPGAIQATMAALTLAPAGLAVWARCGCPVPIWVRTRVRVRTRVAGPVTARLERLPARFPARVPAVARRAEVPARTARATAALPGPATPQRAALPPPKAALPSASVPLRFIRLTRPAPPAADPATRDPSTHRISAKRS